MGKSHRDNARARRKHGPVAYAKKAARRQSAVKCLRCGMPCRPAKLTDLEICPSCARTLGMQGATP